MLLLSITFATELLLICFFMQKCTGCFSMFSIPGSAFIFVFLWHGWYVPVFLFNGQLAGITLDSALKLRFFVVLSLMYIFFFLGISFAKGALQFKLSEVSKYGRMPVVHNLKANYPILYAILAGMMLLTFYFLVKTPASLLAYIQYAGQTELLRQLRNQVGMGAAMDYIFGIGRFVIFPIVTLVLIGMARYEGTLKLKAISLVAFITTSVALFGTLHKGDVFPFLAMVIFFLWLYKGKVRYPLKKLTLFAFIFILCVSAIYGAYYGISLRGGFHQLFSRITVGPNYSLALHLMYLPDKFGFLHGRSIGLLNRIVGNKDFLSLGVLVGRARGHTSGSFNAAFFSGLWADFGYAGVIIGSFLLGAYLQWLQVWLVRSTKSITKLALFAYLLLTVYYLANVSIYPCLLTFGLVSGPIFILLIQFLNDILRGARVGSKPKSQKAFPVESEA